MTPADERERGAHRPVTAADTLWRTWRVAEFFSVSASTVRTYVAMGLPVVRLSPGVVRYDPDEVRAWAAARKSHSILAPHARERAS